jgi:glycosyltransferase involved in cell wall biosynthesis
LRLLHCIHSIDPRVGGPSTFVLQTSQLATELGDKVEIVTLDDPHKDFVKNAPVPVHALGSGMFQYGYSPRLVPWLKRNAQQFDLVVIHGLWQYHALGAWLALRPGQTPYVVFPHGMLDPWFNRTYPLKHAKKSLYWSLVEHRVLADARAVMFTSQEELESARSAFTPYRCNEVVAEFGSPPPPDRKIEQEQALLQKFPHLASQHFLLYLGRIHEKKGVDLLVRAFSEIAMNLQNLCLLIAGPADERYRQLLQSAAGLDSRIIWSDMLSGDVKWGALRGADALILPSHQENFAIVVSEALSCGTPALISDKVNIWRRIEEYSAGLVDKDDIYGARLLLSHWLETDLAQRAEMRRNALRCYADNFNLQQLIKPLMARLATYARGRAGTEELDKHRL